MNLVNKAIAIKRLVPVIKLESVDVAVPLAEALMEGGLPVAEITFRTSAAEQSIKNISSKYPEMLVGAGTVLTVEQAKKAEDAGAKFLVTPGIDDKVLGYCLDKKIPVFPGACTPTEIMRILDYGLEVAKFFPAAQYGGLNTIKALSAPFPNMKFMPTGGVSENNILEYLASEKVIACGGSWMVRDDLIAAKNFTEITKIVAFAVTLISGGS